jgi:hypothetical protein
MTKQVNTYCQTLVSNILCSAIVRSLWDVVGMLICMVEKAAAPAKVKGIFSQSIMVTVVFNRSLLKNRSG